MCLDARPFVAPPKKLLRIDDRIYDVTDFIRKHPGGKVIGYQVDTDASEAYHAFHDRSKKADRYLKSLPSWPAGANDIKNLADSDPLTADFRELREQLREEGYFNSNPAHIAWRMFELVAMHVIGVALAWNGHMIMGLALLGLASGRCGWFMHEGGHYSLSGNIKIDRHLQMFFYGFGCGMSGCYWRNQHNKHHATPQKMKHDVDLETMPLVAFNKACLKKEPSMWIKMQAVMFAPVTTVIVSMGWQFFSHPRHAFRVKNFVELFWMALRLVAWGYAFGEKGFGVAVLRYLLYVQCAGSYIFTNFAVSHTHKAVVPKDEHRTWVQYSSDHTTNCAAGPICNWWMSFLNFQIEHHLFPSMPQYNHPVVSKRVQALFKKHNVDYDVRPYWTAIWDTICNLHAVGHDHEHDN